MSRCKILDCVSTSIFGSAEVVYHLIWTVSWELWKLWPGKILHPTHTEPSLRMEIALMKTTAREHKHHWQTKTRSHTRRPWDSSFSSDSTLSWWLFSGSLMVKCTVTLSVCLFKTVIVPNNTLNGASLDSNTHNPWASPWVAALLCVFRDSEWDLIVSCPSSTNIYKSCYWQMLDKMKCELLYLNTHLGKYTAH